MTSLKHFVEAVTRYKKQGDDILLGIGNRTMSFKYVDVFTAYAESLGKAVDELTETEKKQAVLDAVLAHE